MCVIDTQHVFYSDLQACEEALIVSQPGGDCQRISVRIVSPVIQIDDVVLVVIGAKTGALDAMRLNVVFHECSPFELVVMAGIEPATTGL